MSEAEYGRARGRLREAAGEVRWLLAILRDPDGALATYDLTPDERERFIQECRRAALGLRRTIEEIVEGDQPFTIDLPGGGTYDAARPQSGGYQSDLAGIVIPPWPPDDEQMQQQQEQSGPITPWGDGDDDEEDR